MNHCGIHRNNTFEEMRSSVSVSLSFENSGEPMVCPKPRRLSLFNSTVNEPVRPLRWQMCYQSESFESKAGPELLDIIFSKGGSNVGSDQPCTNIASSPPFFSGSPPSRVSNPLIQDARFGDEKVIPISPRQMVPIPAASAGVSSASSQSSSARKGGCLRSNFGNKPAVRVEGFDCLDRDNRRNCSIPTLA
ncbi:uncharacterized protein [Rutidosis leptorrhynchoides]|uniref:uncharacterized protein n=1 Tax=Rutidosis leptorrhynchoides TaxID=125765 RepID=UPI003A9A37C9